MDPEAGGPTSPIGGQGSRGPPADPQSSVMRIVIQALWTRIHALLEGVLTPKQREIGVENRFYYDETDRQWKLKGGETEQDRLEAEALRFHTSRGMSTALAPPTTACDATRGAPGGELAPPPPPPTGGPVSRSINNPTGFTSAALSHPVYAPQGFGVQEVPSAPPTAMQRPAPAAPPSATRTNPFGPPAAGAPAPAAPLTSPFGAAPQAAAQETAATSLVSPFASQPVNGQEEPMKRQTSPFKETALGGHDPMLHPAGAMAPPMGAGPGQGSPLVPASQQYQYNQA